MRLSALARVAAATLLTSFSAIVAGAQVQDGSFEQNVVPGSNQYQYSGFQPGPPTTPGPAFNSPWTFGPGSGLIVGTGSAFNTPSPFPDGMQVAFLQGQSSFIEQMIASLNPGTYSLSFYTAGRQSAGANNGDATFAVSFGGMNIFTGATSSFQPFTLNTVSFSTMAGGTLRFDNTSLPGDRTYFLDDVTLVQTSTATPEPATIALVGGGLLALGGFVRRRKA